MKFYILSRIVWFVLLAVYEEVRLGLLEFRKSPDIVTHVIAANEVRSGAVAGLTVHNNELFIVRRHQPKRRIEVYSVTNFTFERYIEINELGYGKEVSGLTSCDTNNCLYVGHWCHAIGDGSIVRVELTGNNRVIEWKLEDGHYLPQSLSVNSQHNLLVACWGGSQRKLIEYTTRGELVRQILQPDDVMCPWHAIQLNNSQFVVCHGDYSNSLHRVCVVDANGRILLSYGNKRGSETGQLNEPRHLAIDRHGFIFVADQSNDRIVMLDCTLKFTRDMPVDVRRPYSLYLDEQRNQLFVGEWNDENSRVVVVAL